MNQYRRQENIAAVLQGDCTNCGATKSVRLEEHDHLEMQYKIGSCSDCMYEHHIRIK